MKTVLTPDGTIENEGGLQAVGFAWPDVSIVDVGETPAAATLATAASLLDGSLPYVPTAALTNGLAAAPTVSVSGAAGVPLAPLHINAILGDSIVNKVSTVADPTTALQIENAIAAAITFFETHFTSSVPLSVVNGITVNLNFDYGFVDAADPDPAKRVTMTPTSGAGRSISNATLLDYATVRSALPGLPLLNPTGNGTFYVPYAQMKELGLSTQTANGPITGQSTEVDGSIGLNTIANGVTLAYDPLNQAVPGAVGAIGLLEHEITEALGRVAVLGQQFVAGTPSYSILDLFRYSGAGARVLTAGTAASFSTDGGATLLGGFNAAASGDAADWSGTAVPGDAFDAFLTTGTTNAFSSLDTAVMSALGLAAVTCYREGTRLLTPASERPIETLAVGDELTLAAGGTGRVVWLGRRALDLTRHPQPSGAWPVRVRAGAFAAGVPARDLWLSPDHAVFVEGALIPVKRLLNGATIAQVPMGRVVYWHVELERHAVILAEGLPAETYLDAGDRATFGGGGVVALYPDFAARQWETEACAPLVLTGPVLEAARAMVTARATALEAEHAATATAVSAAS